MYYTRRRYLFTGSVLRWFTGASACPACGAVLTGKGGFCPSCGGKIEGRPRSRLKWGSLDSPQHCPACGRDLCGRDLCPQCYTTEEFRDAMKDYAKDAVKGEVLKYALLILVAVMVFTPLFLGDALGCLTKGSAQVNNAYTDRVNEWLRDPAVAEDGAWLAAFDAAAQDLYDYDAREFRAVSRRMSYLYLYIYIQYLEGSYDQMAVMQDLSEAVHGGRCIGKRGAGSVFQRDAEYAAAGPGERDVPAPGHEQAPRRGEHRGGRSEILFVLSAGGASHRPAVRPGGDGARRRAAAARQDRLCAVIGAGIAVVGLGLCFFLETRMTPAPEPTYESEVDRGFTMNGVVLTAWLAQTRTDPAVALAADLIAALDEAQAALERGELPSQETAERVSGLLAEGMKLDQDIQIGAAFAAVEDLF